MDNIVLIGFMGSGKTSVAKKLAEVSAYKLVDTDKLIEEKENKKISDIFSDNDEKYFRDIESQVLLKLQSNFNLVISTGGGIVLREANRDVLKKLGKVVYLRVTPETVVKRLQHDTSRPLLMGDDKHQKVKEIMDYREPIYQDAADIIIDTDNLSKKEIAEKILSAKAPITGE